MTGLLHWIIVALLLTGFGLAVTLSFAIKHIEKYKALLDAADLKAIVHFLHEDNARMGQITGWYVATTTGCYWTGDRYTTHLAAKKVYPYVNKTICNKIVLSLGFSQAIFPTKAY